VNSAKKSSPRQSERRGILKEVVPQRKKKKNYLAPSLRKGRSTCFGKDFGRSGPPSTRKALHRRREKALPSGNSLGGSPKGINNLSRLLVGGRGMHFFHGEKLSRVPAEGSGD